MKLILTKCIFFSILWVCTLPSFADGFPLISKDKPIIVNIEKTEKLVVQTSLDIFFADVELVSNKKVQLTTNYDDLSIIVGTIGTNKYIDRLIEKKIISVDEIKNQWEAFHIQVISFENKKHLIVVGSDGRGTAYGILELSRLIGVSPWVWWADVLPDEKDEVILPDNYFMQQKPSVQYRGIFLNDEDWGLAPWSSKNFEQTARTGQIGPKTYARIFELLLRLRANMLWPAMHESTVPFYFVEGNKEMADKYGIVLGTSHCEPLMRNGAGEWDSKKYGEYNYLTNKATINNYWGERLKEAGQFENFYTIGMRGVHDGHMEGVKTLDEQTSVLSDVISNQRRLLTEYIGKDAPLIPQAFIPYKEVLSVYENGLKLPDDVTLVWCDDNYGYVTRLSNKEEQKRKGGAGIYYHISYWGRPHDYLWLATTQPSLIYYQMKKAWDANVRKLWVLNVGDIKPAEYEIEFFLDMAWDINSISAQNIYTHMNNWLSREFGKELTAQLSDVKKEYYRLANIRKPEFMGWSRVEEYSAIKGGKTPIVDTEFNPFVFGDEIQKRIADYSRISDTVKNMESRISENRKSAYFQLMTYPVLSASEMNKKLLYAQKARLYAGLGLPVANEYTQLSDNAYNAIAALTHSYNRDISGKKWEGMMDMKPRNLAVFEKASLPNKCPFKDKEKALVWIENEDKPADIGSRTILPTFIKNVRSQTFIALFQRQDTSIDWQVKEKPDWLKISEINSDMHTEKRLIVDADWTRIDKNKVTGKCVLSVDGNNYELIVEAVNQPMESKVESNRMIAFNANEFKVAKKAQIIEGLGHSLGALELSVGVANYVEYEILTTSVGEAIIKTCLIPNHPHEGKVIRYAISVDNETPQIVSFNTEFRSEPWKVNVLRNQAVKETVHKILKTGKHRVRIYALDEGVVLDQLMIEFDKERKHYAIPVMY